MRESYIEQDFSTGSQRWEELLEYDANGVIILDEYEEDFFAVAKEIRVHIDEDYDHSIYKIAELNGAVFDALSGHYRTASQFWKDFKFRTVSKQVFDRYIKYLTTKKTSDYSQVARSYLND